MEKTENNQNSFEGIIEFVAVAELNSFSIAAKRLGCSTSHVSRQISRLEKRLKCSLFARTTRMINLTALGDVYFQHCKVLLSGLEQANEHVSGEQLKLAGTLRVSMAGLFAEQNIAPVLISFAQQHPELAIDIDFNSRKIDFIEDHVDFAIRYGQLQDSGLVARKLVDRQLMVTASPTYLKKHGEPTHPTDLKQHSCLITNNDQWSFIENGVPFNMKVQGRWKSNNVHTVIHACENHLGIAYLPKTTFLQSIQNATLKPILNSYLGTHSSSWIVFRNRRFLPARARLAIDFLVSHFQDWKE